MARSTDTTVGNKQRLRNLDSKADDLDEKKKENQEKYTYLSFGWRKEIDMSRNVKAVQEPKAIKEEQKSSEKEDKGRKSRDKRQSDSTEDEELIESSSCQRVKDICGNEIYYSDEGGECPFTPKANAYVSQCYVTCPHMPPAYLRTCSCHDDITPDKCLKEADKKRRRNKVVDAKKAETEAKQANAEAKKAEAEAKKADAVAKKAAAEAKKAEAEFARFAEAEERRNEEEAKRAEDECRRKAEAEAKKRAEEKARKAEEAKRAEAEKKRAAEDEARRIAEIKARITEVEAKKSEAACKKAEADAKKAEAELRKCNAYTKKCEKKNSRADENVCVTDETSSDVSKKSVESKREKRSSGKSCPAKKSCSNKKSSPVEKSRPIEKSRTTSKKPCEDDLDEGGKKCYDQCEQYFADKIRWYCTKTPSETEIEGGLDRVLQKYGEKRLVSKLEVISWKNRRIDYFIQKRDQCLFNCRMCMQRRKHKSTCG